MTSGSSLIRKNYIIILAFIQNRLIKNWFLCWFSRRLFNSFRRFLKKFIYSVEFSQKPMSFHIFHKKNFLFWRWKNISWVYTILMSRRTKSCSTKFFLIYSFSNKIRGLVFQLIDFVEIITSYSFVKVCFWFVHNNLFQWKSLFSFGWVFSLLLLLKMLEKWSFRIFWYPRYTEI